MTKEYRAELRDLRRSKAKVERDAKREITAAMKQKAAACKKIDLHILQVTRKTSKWLETIDHRIAILEGRLS